jgi:hypothetical protein
VRQVRFRPRRPYWNNLPRRSIRILFDFGEWKAGDIGRVTFPVGQTLADLGIAVLLTEVS